MNNEQRMLDEVKRYLSDDTYDYAMMIDGAWGSGKTYFVKEVLNKELNAIKIRGINNRVRYYSACGMESLGEFKETMIYDLLERKADEIHDIISQDLRANAAAIADEDPEDTSELKGPVEQVLETKKKLVRDIIEEQREGRQKRLASLKATRAFRIAVDIGGKMVTGLLKSKVPFLGAVDARDYLADVEELQDYVFIIDDIERCSFSVAGLLGFINEMVEHVHAKVILVINEDALLRKQKDPRFLGEYLDYLGIKEKLVGTVLKYSSDDPAVLDKLIRGELEEGSLFRNGMLIRIPDFVEKMESMKYHNLRTFQFFLSRLKNIEEQLKSAEAGDETENAADGIGIRDDVVENLLTELFDICLNFRIAATAAEKEYRFKSLENYVKRGILDVERLKAEIRG